MTLSITAGGTTDGPAGSFPLPAHVAARALVDRLASQHVPVALDAPVPRAEPPARAGGLVIGYGAAADLAERYAGALGRPFQSLPAGHSLPDAVTAAGRGSRSVFVLLPEPDLDLALVKVLVENARGQGVRLGLLPLPQDPSEAAFLVVRAWALARPTPRHAHRALLYCDFRRDALPGPLHSYGSETSSDFVTALGEGAEAVVLHSHGNGADFRVGSHVLCLQVDPLRPSPGRPGERFLPCQGGGHCRLEHKTGFRAFHGASALRTRLLVLLSCSAYQPADGLLGARFQLSRTLLYGPHVAGFVASTRINHGTPQLGVAVERLLDEGASLGEVALRVNLLAGDGLASYLCVGDPDLALPARTRPRPAPAATRPAGRAATRASAAGPDPVPRPPDPRAARQRLYAEIVRRGVEAGDHPVESRELADRLAERADRWSARAPDPAPVLDRRLDRRLCAFLGATLALRGPDAHDYLSGTVGYSPEELTGLRHLCGHRLLRLRVVSREVAGGTLALYVCERCGTAHTQPQDMQPPEVHCSARELTVTFAGPLVHGGWYTAARQPIGGHRERATPVRALPPGATAVTLPLTAGHTAGLRRFAVAVVADGDFTIHQLPLVDE